MSIHLVFGFLIFVYILYNIDILSYYIYELKDTHPSHHVPPWE